MDKLKMCTPNLADEKFTALASMFPNAVTETIDENGVVVRAIDADILAQEINTHVVSGKEERYQFTWPDKKKSVLLANAPIAAALRPCREESVDFDITENLYIEGDNLDVLKLLRETYLNRVKLIYIDPPYNTGKDFIYEDDFAEETGEFLRRDGQYDEQGNRLIKNPDTNGRFHTDWLNMIYPRLRIARDLLADDGLIIINIDEHEITNLQKVCIEIFGATNDLGTIIWDKRNPKGDAKGVSYQHEYIILFAKNKKQFLANCKMMRPKKNAEAMIKKAEQIFRKIGPSFTLDEANAEFQAWISLQKDLSGGEAAYKYIDAIGEVYRTVSMAWPNNKKAPDDYFVPLVHPNTGKLCPIPAKGWRYPSATMRELLAAGQIIFGKDETKQPERKYLLRDNMYENIPSLLYYGGSDSDMLSEMGIPFDTPKVVNIVKEHLLSFTSDGDIVLDFFSGSATTAHAVMQLNAESKDSTRRKFIMVQLAEDLDKNYEKASADEKTVIKRSIDFLDSIGKPHYLTEIGKERIRRAGKKIKEEYKDKPGIENLDIGFRVLKLDSSNMKEVYYTPEEYAQMSFNLEGFMDNIKPDRTEEDLLFQVMLDLGIPLSAKIRQEGEIFYVNDNYLIACFGRVDTALITEIAKKKPYYAVFCDSSFINDSAMVNFEQVFSTYSPNTIRRVL
jgi:adenine-specific DNA-methyltransferase